jgi:endonuclease/exonuclease/phosphatase family metal-dependent hydrolase
MTPNSRARLRRLRVATLNLWHLSEPWERRVGRIRDELARLAPDVVGLQEVVADPARDYDQAREVGLHEGYHRVYFPAGPYGDGTIGNAVLSRYPIAAASSRTLPFADGRLARIAVRADLALFEGTLSFFCTHLSYRADESHKREAQVAALDRFVREAPRDLPRIVVGDFNADPDSTAIRFFTGKATIGGCGTYYQDAAALRGATAPTWAERNPYTEPFYEGDRRIDYVFVTHARDDGCGAVASCRLAFDEPAVDGTFASDHFGVFAEVWIAPPRES